MTYSTSFDLINSNLDADNYLAPVTDQVKQDLGLEVKAVDLGELFFIED